MENCQGTGSPLACPGSPRRRCPARRFCSRLRNQWPCLMLRPRQSTRDRATLATSPRVRISKQILRNDNPPFSILRIRPTTQPAGFADAKAQRACSTGLISGKLQLTGECVGSRYLAQTLLD